jgi:hypothetical protein
MSLREEWGSVFIGSSINLREYFVTAIAIMGRHILSQDGSTKGNPL